MGLPYKRSEVKERTRAEWKGLCNVTLPSFNEDFTKLNEAGIRHDIKLAAKHGFWGTLVASESGTTLDEYMQFMEIAADAAPKGFKLVSHASFSTAEEGVKATKRSAELGYESVLLSYPPSARLKTPKDVVDFTRDFSQQSDISIILFIVLIWGFKHMHPSGFPQDALEEMAKFDTVAAVKYEASPPAMPAGLADTLRRCAEHAIIECPLEQYHPGLIDWYGMQWAGTSSYESFGDRAPKMFNLLHEAKASGDRAKWDEGMKMYWSYQPGRDAKSAFHATFPGANLIHRTSWKYLSWLQGYNGGLLRMPQMRLTGLQARGLRQGLQASGFELPADDEGFYLGRNPA